MLCNKCYKKIPEGEEIMRGMPGFIDALVIDKVWKGGCARIICVRCAKKTNKKRRINVQ